MADVRGQINFKQIGLGDLLKQHKLVVPANQREYAWTEKEVTTLLKDFAKAISDQETDYFVGTIVTIPKSTNTLEVVDGQQRLATTAILLCEIRNYLVERDPLIAQDITSRFLSSIDRTQRERVANMTLNLEDNEFFRRMILRTEPDSPLPVPDKASHRLIADAFKQCEYQIKRVVQSFDQKDHWDVLNKWIEFTESVATVILLKVPSDVNAYKMFETLNDRDLKTSQADLVKNYLFGKSAARLQEAQQKWALMRGTLESLEEDDVTVTFLQYVLIALNGFVTKYALYEAVQSIAKSPTGCADFLTQAETLAGDCVALFNSDHEKWNAYPDSIRRALQTLSTFDIRPLRPLMLAVACKFSTTEASVVFRKFISWCVRWLLASSTRTGSLENLLADAATSVYKQNIKSATDLSKSLDTIIPNDEQFRQAFELNNVSNRKLARYR